MEVNRTAVVLQAASFKFQMTGLADAEKVDIH